MKDILTSLTERLGNTLVNDVNKLDESLDNISFEDILENNLTYDFFNILMKEDEKLYSMLEEFSNTNVKVRQLWAKFQRKSDIEARKQQKPQRAGYRRVSDGCGGYRTVYTC